MKLLFSLFNPAYGFVRALVGLMLGLAMVVWPGTAAVTVVKLIGAVLIIIGAVSVAMSFKDSEGHPGLLSFNGFFDIVFGICLVVFASFFVKLIMYLFGLVMLIFGVGQIVNLSSVRKIVSVGVGYYVLPVLISICGLVLISNPFKAQEMLFMVFGAGLIVYSVSEIISTLILRKAYKVQKQHNDNLVEDVAYEEINSEAVDTSDMA